MDTMRINAKKSLGQHFLNNNHIPALMIDAGDVGENDVILEIGPGTGVLTRALLARAKRVVALEADARAITILHEIFHNEIMAQKLEIIHGDIRTYNLSTLNLQPGAYKLIANIPYYLSGFLFRKFLESSFQPSVIVFLVQREVAERIARDTKESLLSLSVKVFGTPKYIKTVGRGNFTPPPKVDSAILSITHISKEHMGSIPQSFFFTVLHAGFASKRKQLLGNLCTLLPRTQLVSIFSTLSIPLTLRGEDLHLLEWITLVAHIHRTIQSTPQN